MQSFVFEIGVGHRAATLVLRDGLVTDEFIDLAGKADRIDAEASRLDDLKADLVRRLPAATRRRGLRRRLTVRNPRLGAGLPGHRRSSRVHRTCDVWQDPEEKFIDVLSNTTRHFVLMAMPMPRQLGPGRASSTTETALKPLLTCPDAMILKLVENPAENTFPIGLHNPAREG